MYLYIVLSIQNQSNKIHSYTKIFYTTVVLLEPNTEADIDIIARVIDNIDFISQNSSKRGGGWISLSSRVLYEVPLVSVKLN
jgi:hypothetical protein